MRTSRAASNGVSVGSKLPVYIAEHRPNEAYELASGYGIQVQNKRQLPTALANIIKSGRQGLKDVMNIHPDMDYFTQNEFKDFTSSHWNSCGCSGADGSNSFSGNGKSKCATCNNVFSSATGNGKAAEFVKENKDVLIFGIIALAIVAIYKM